MTDNLYRGRLAPSPTGLLHLGHAATFLAAYQRARAANGTLLLRNEDLDPHRSKAEFTAAMLEDLAWLGIAWTPPMVTQSERLPLYMDAFKKLLAMGLAYPCTCSRKDLAQMLSAPHEDGEVLEVLDDEPIYSGRCRPAEPTPCEFQAGVNYRFRVPDQASLEFADCGVVEFTDLNLGDQKFFAAANPAAITTTLAHTFGDFLIWRKGDALSPAGLPSYQLACIVDDAAMQITEVVRGADLLKSTARQILLQRALSLPTPQYFHTPLLRDENGTRLAKRHDALAIRTLRKNGMMSEQVINTMKKFSWR